MQTESDFLTHLHTQGAAEQQAELRRLVKAIEEVFQPVHLFRNEQMAELVHSRKGYVPFAVVFQQGSLIKYLEGLGCRPISTQQCLLAAQILIACVPKYSKSLRVNPSGIRLLRCGREKSIFQVYFQDIDFSCFDHEWFEALLASKCDIYQIKYYSEQGSALVYTNEPAYLLKLEQELQLDAACSKKTRFRVRSTEVLERGKEFANRVGSVCETQSSNIKGFPCLSKIVKKKVKIQGKKAVVEAESQLKFKDYGQLSNFISYQKTQDGRYLVKVQGEYDYLPLSSQGQQENQFYRPL